ncbi:hypothetical protein [Niabella ginsengisoli]|uniref:PorT family protein n=1 Tax=Niabella ginsengisoli TaxID=522298 RepID=A0ABS9SN90_9BACT|nr:hypothetical protein [Niabella ginsengisoli]MCH5599808.1 hypothetical protein [Niabella ginsengisoli]
MKKLVLTYIIMLLLATANAQHAAFVNSGKIRFERNVNTFAAMGIF